MTIHQVNLAVYPTPIQVQAGDIIRVTTEFDYAGPALSGTVYTALWNWTLVDPHNEIAHGTKPFNVPDSPEPGNHVTAYVDITFPRGYSEGLHYGLYSKIMGVPGEPRTEYYEKIIELVEAPLPEKYTIDGTSEPVDGGYWYLDPYQELYDRLDVVGITAVSLPGYAFDYWMINDSKANYNPASVIMMRDVYIVCHFRRL